MERNFYTLILGVLAIIFCQSSYLQAQNLITNPSFESGAWAQANTGSADWLTASNVFGTQTPRTGTRMMGQAFGNQGGSGFREYIKSPLTSPTVIGTAYYVEYLVSLSENYGAYATNYNGMALTPTSPFFSFSNGPIPLTPQVYSLTPLTSKTAWEQVSGTFTATGVFNFATIGNFHSDAATTYQFVGGGSFTYGYYFMDDATVQIATVFGNDFVSFEVEAKHDGTVQLDWEVAQDNEGKIFEVQRSVGGQEFQNIKNIRREDNENGLFNFVDAQAPYNTPIRYRLLQNDANGNIHYSEEKEVKLAAEGQGELLALFPTMLNAEQPLQLEYLMRVENGPVNVKILDITGRNVFNHTFEGTGGKNTFWIMPQDLAPASYVMQIEAEGKHDFARFQIVK